MREEGALIVWPVYCPDFRFSIHCTIFGFICPAHSSTLCLLREEPPISELCTLCVYVGRVYIIAKRRVHAENRRHSTFDIDRLALMLATHFSFATAAAAAAAASTLQMANHFTFFLSVNQSNLM